MSLISTHELVAMSTEEARAKWERLAGGVARLRGNIITITLVPWCVRSSNSSTKASYVGLLKSLEETLPWDSSIQRWIIKVIEGTLVPNDVPSDENHFSMLCFPYIYSMDFLYWLLLASKLRSWGLEDFACTPFLISMDLDDEMRTWAREKFNTYWADTAQGVWRNDIVRDHIWERQSARKCQLFSPSGRENEIFKPGPYSKRDLEEWFASMPPPVFNSTPQDQLDLGSMFAGLSLDGH